LSAKGVREDEGVRGERRRRRRSRKRRKRTTLGQAPPWRRGASPGCDRGKDDALMWEYDGNAAIVSIVRFPYLPHPHVGEGCMDACSIC